MPPSAFRPVIPLSMLALAACSGAFAGPDFGPAAQVSIPESSLIYVTAPPTGSRVPSAQERPLHDPETIRKVAAAAADQVSRCYRFPRIRAGGRRIVTRLRVRFAPDGSLVDLPVVVDQQGVTASGGAHAAAMAQAASMAVIRCAPVRLPPELHKGGWDELQLTFSPQVRA